MQANMEEIFGTMVEELIRRAISRKLGEVKADLSQLAKPLSAEQLEAAAPHILTLMELGCADFIAEQRRRFQARRSVPTPEQT